MENKTHGMQVYDALKLAVEYIESNKLMYKDRYKLTVTRAENEWVFWFVFLPETPGVDITVFVTNDGQIKSMQGI